MLWRKEMKVKEREERLRVWKRKELVVAVVKVER